MPGDANAGASAASGAGNAADPQWEVAQARHRAMLEAALDCIVTMDHTGRVVEFNPAAEATFGYRSEEAVGQEMAELIVPPDLRERHRAGLARYMRDGFPRVLDQRLEVEAIRRDGSRIPVELTITRIDLPGPAIFTAYIRDITDRHRAEMELRASRARVVEAGYEARRRIERDLHDGAQQQLVAVTMTLRMVRARIEQGNAEGALEMLAEASDDLSTAISELRELARGIHPAVLTEGGLEPALRGLVQRSAVPAVLLAVPAERFAATAEAAIYYAVAEALTNVARHAEAANIEVEVATAAGRLWATVQDDGVGGASEGAGTGLRGLSDRLAVLDGTLIVDSPRGAGTKVRVEVPCGS